MHCHLHRGDWNFHLTNEKKKFEEHVLEEKLVKHVLQHAFGHNLC